MDFRKAAVGRRKTWQGHDERDEGLCRLGAYQLFDALTDSTEEELYTAGEMVKDAFWFADRAEKYQGEDPELEDEMYGRSTRLLKEARDTVDLPYEAMEYRGNGWWRSYRREDRLEALADLAREHYAEFGLLGTLSSTKSMLDAAKGHDEGNWTKVDDRLEKYYEAVGPKIADVV